MKKHTARDDDDDLRPEYDLSQLKGGVRGKYYMRATAGPNLVLIEPDLNEASPSTESIDRPALTGLLGRIGSVKPAEWLRLATRPDGQLLADPDMETRSAKGQAS
jgi:hypothetical protein